ncbi:hypothetical protein CC80DRAFT_156208 [Byssothecium circinans]|uniref:Cell wall proline rich protein n=1 Tax=Byssothecium circinans TaxID=147558 RepID=A0A6A5UBP2_9PLEO|nr:hypothetical protein CC80DRAFT_156208 [Byssothecium circinans]
MAQIALPRQQVTQTQQSHSAAVGSPLYQRRRQSNTGSIELLPNPDFTFPMRPDRTSSEPTTSALNAHPMSLQVNPTGRRGSTPGRMRQKSVNTLPDFSFNPAGTTQPPAAPSSPPHSPFSLSTPTTPSRAIGGHRRGGSEFIGGDGRVGTTTLLSTSPTKLDGVVPQPTSMRVGPPAGRRGHAHRRSGAVSSHDLTTIMKPTAVPAASAPVTPLEGPKFAFGHSVNKSMSQPSLRGTALHEDVESTPRPPSRARVGFSDKVEYIRPLSTISSETETSLSTIRGHSAANSISSVLSSGATSPAPNGRPSISPTKPAKEDNARPSTAGAILDMQKNPYLGADLANRKRPSSAVSLTPVASPNSPTIPPKRRSFFRLESRRSDNSVLTLSNASDPTLSVPLDSPLPSPVGENGEYADDSDKAKSRKSSRTPRKVKSWASSIIPKKSKNNKKAKGRAPTPPPRVVLDVDDTDASEDLDFDAIFDADNTVTIVSPTEDAFPEQKPQADYTSWQPREFKRVDSDIMSPVIDLDAALGPFNTPQGSSPRLSQRGFAAHRRAMHSAGIVLQNHRRTESAPELVPFELRTLAVPTTSTMADVFEEDEPEEQTVKSDPADVSEEQEDVEEPKIEVVEADSVQTGSSINWNFDDGLGIKRAEKPCKSDRREPDSPLTIEEELTSNEQSAGNDVVEVVEDFEEPRTSSLTHSSDSTITIPAPVDETKERQPVMNLSLPLPQQSLMTPDTIASSFSSPDYRSSQASFDTPRLGTAASSMTDYPAMPSPRFGEPGPEMRISVDDVPSLTSSRSTTSAMHNVFSLGSPRRPGDRSSSLCSVPSDGESHRRKRSSIASLSRLINSSSFREGSKLAQEMRPQSEYLEPTHKEKKKHKRLSKLMQFWKSKDSSRT